MIHRLPELDEHVGVFADRRDAGRRLAELLLPLAGTDAVVLAIPSGGVPVAAELARTLGLPLDVAVVSKVTLPWNTEVGCGAVAFDGSSLLDRPFADQVGLSDQSYRRAVEQAREKVKRRLALYRSARPAVPLEGRTAVLVDDGVASGATLQLAAQAVRRAGAAKVLIAVPTGLKRSLEALDAVAEGVYCANVRSHSSFSVARAYRDWHDEDEEDVARWLASLEPYQLGHP